MFQNDHRLSLVLSIGLVTLYVVRYIQSPWRKLPPGPKGVPIFGNLFQLTSKQWVVFTEWRKVFGSLIYVNVAGQGILVLSSEKVVNDLLNNRAGKTSGRLRNIVAGEILTGGLFFPFIGHTNLWRRMRKAAHEGLNKSVVSQYFPKLTAEAILLTSGILAQPKDWDAHLRRTAASSTLAMVYDHPPVASEHDPSVRKVNDIGNRMTRDGMPGAHLVEFFPWMLYIPRSLAMWKRVAQDWYQHDSKMLEDLFSDVRHRVAGGDTRPSLSAILVEKSSFLGLSERENAWVSGSVYIAGSETAAGVMSWWILAMMAYPETQERAQAEIDVVVGRSRLPTFTDYDHLPYIQAMVKETLRWRPVAPVGMPHYSSEDDWYEGMFIPKGTLYVPNVWHLNRDPETYGPDADHFNPARFLEALGKIGPGPADTKNEGHFSYGFGRRNCVGRHFANNFLFINIATMLWAMNIEQVTDDQGNLEPLDTDGSLDDGMMIRPVPFKCKTTPRFSEVVDILEQEKELMGH